MKAKRKLGFGGIFFFVILLIYILLFIINFNYAKSAFENFLISLIKVLPIVFIVFVIMFFVNAFLNPKKINAHLGKASGIRGWFYTIIPSVLIPAPPYVLFPILGDLKKHGMKNSLLVFFLYNRNIQISFFPAFVYYFGLSFAAIAAGYIFIFSIISANLMGKILNKKSKSFLHSKEFHYFKNQECRPDN